MKEMIKNYRGTLISSALVILAGILVGFTSIQGKWLNVFFIDLIDGNLLISPRKCL